MLDPIINVFDAVLGAFKGWTGSPGWSIILMTVLLRALLLPLNIKQMRSMQKMQDLTPKRQALEKKHKGDPQKLNQAVMELYKEEGVNPFAGCLPLLVQMPILWAMFRTLSPGPGIIAPWLEGGTTMFLGLDLLTPVYGGENAWKLALAGQVGYIVLPVLVAVTTFLQTLLTTPQGQQEGPQKTMLYAMPLLFGWFSLQFPTGLSLYYTMSNVIGIAQGYFMRTRRQSGPGTA